MSILVGADRSCAALLLAPRRSVLNTFTAKSHQRLIVPTLLHCPTNTTFIPGDGVLSNTGSRWFPNRDLTYAITPILVPQTAMASATPSQTVTLHDPFMPASLFLPLDIAGPIDS